MIGTQEKKPWPAPTGTLLGYGVTGGPHERAGEVMTVVVQRPMTRSGH
jgi:hypothetical protein